MSGKRFDALVSKERNGKRYFTKIGAGFQNQDGSISLHLDALPTDGEVWLKEPNFDDRGGGGGNRGGGGGGRSSRGGSQQRRGRSEPRRQQADEYLPDEGGHGGESDDLGNNDDGPM